MVLENSVQRGFLARAYPDIFYGRWMASSKQSISSDLILGLIKGLLVLLRIRRNDENFRKRAFNVGLQCWDSSGIRRGVSLVLF